MTAFRTALILLFCALLSAGCSSWGGKMNNTEGVSYYSKGQYDQALEAFQTAARLNPEDPEVYYNIASTYQQQALRYQDVSLLTQAETNYRVCLQKKPTHETTVCCYRGLASVLNQKKEGDLALKTLKEWEEKEPTSIEPKLEIAYLLEAQGKNEEAADALTKIKEWAPNDYRAFYKLGVVKEKMGDDAGALEELRTAATLNPTNQEITTKITSIEGKKAPSAADSIPSEPGTASEPAGSANNESVWTAPNTGSQVKTAAEEKSGSVTYTSQPAEQIEIPSDGFTAVPDPNEPVFNPPQPDGVVPQSSPLDSELPDFNPSYSTPAAGTVPAAEPVPTAPPAPADPKKEAENVDSLFEVDTLGSGTTSSSYAPSELTLTRNSVQNQVLSIPDGTGSQPYKLAYSGAVPVSSSTLTAAASAENTANAGTSKKSRVGVANPGPPRTSVGVPF